MTERRAAEEAVGHRANPTPANALPNPDWDSGNVPMTALQPGSPPKWHTLHHGLGSTNLLVDAKLGGTNAQGQAVWSLSTETLFALSGPNTVTFRWNLDEEVVATTSRSWVSRGSRGCGCGFGAGDFSFPAGPLPDEREGASSEASQESSIS